MVGSGTRGVRPRRGWPLLVLLLVACLVVSLLAAGRVAWVAAGGGSTPDDLRAQARFLSAAVQDGAAERMQDLFPEGHLFTVVLTGLALAASSDQGTRSEDHRRLRELVAMTESPSGTAPFAATGDLPHGVFHAAWTLLLRTEAARLGGSPQDLAELSSRAGVLRAAVDASGTGVLEAYPGQVWPVDTVVAVAALERADRLLGTTSGSASTRRWLARTDSLRDPRTGLLPHRTTPRGVVLEGPRGTSQSIVQLFWPDVDPAGAAQQWGAFVRTFVVRRGAAAVGVREFPEGTSGGGDVDSGPLVLGMSASATVVTLGAARRAGDLELATDLDRESEVAGLPVQLFGERRYLGGVLPVGDAFLAFARAQPAGEPIASTAPGVRWWLVLVALMLPGAGALAVLLALRRTRWRRR